MVSREIAEKMGNLNDVVKQILICDEDPTTQLTIGGVFIECLVFWLLSLS